MVDDHVLDGDQHQEDHRADDVIAAYDKASESFDHVTGSRCAGISVEQNQPRRGDIQRQPVKRQQQQSGGKYAEIHGAADIHRDHHHDHRQHDVDDDQKIQHHARHGHDQRDDDRDDGDRDAHFADSDRGFRSGLRIRFDCDCCCLGCH